MLQYARGTGGKSPLTGARTAKEYILYRAERTRVREMNTRLMKVYEGLTFQSAKDNDIKRENANIDGDTAMGTMLKYGSEGAKQFTKCTSSTLPMPRRILGWGHSHSRYGLSDPHHHLLPDRHRQALYRRLQYRTRISAEPNDIKATPPWPVSPSSPTKTTSTADRAFRTLTTLMAKGVKKDIPPPATAEI